MGNTGCTTGVEEIGDGKFEDRIEKNKIEGEDLPKFSRIYKGNPLDMRNDPYRNISMMTRGFNKEKNSSKNIYDINDPFNFAADGGDYEAILSSRFYENDNGKQGVIEKNGERKIIKADFNSLDHRPNFEVVFKKKMNQYSELAKTTLSKFPFYRPNRGAEEKYENHPVYGPYEYKSGSTYKGQYIFGQRSGFGEEVEKDGGGYEGEWENDRRHGKGRYVASNGDYFQGDFVDDVPHGRGLKYNKKTGLIYEGDIIKNEITGKGKETYPDGSYYEGNFFKGKRHGIGSFKFKDGSKYEGEFRYDEITGKGVHVYNDGRKYEGNFKENFKHGYGEFYMKNGVVYKGDFVLGKKEGKGVMRW